MTDASVSRPGQAAAAGAPGAPSNPAGSEFAAMCESFVDDLFADNPIAATLAGRTDHDHELPDLSEAGHRRRFAMEDGWHARFSAIDPTGLTADARIDRELVLMSLRRRQLTHGWGEWRRTADAYLQAGLVGVELLFVQAQRPEPELVEAAAARLAQVPDVLAAARANLDAALASPLLLGRAIRQARSAARWAREELPALASTDDGSRRLSAAADPAAAAYADTADALEQLARSAAGDWAVGEAHYDALLREAEGLPFGTRELRDRGRAEYDTLAAELSRRARELTGDDDWRALAQELGDDRPATPEDMLAAFADWTARAREFCVERDLVTLPEGERCEVVPSPPFQRAVYAVPYYMRPPAFSDSLTGHLFVPYPPDDASPEQVDQRLAGNNYATIPTTAVHEAYPGHHWHLSWASSRRLNPLRRVLATSYFTEGWALYAEDLFREQGFFTDPRQEFGQVVKRLFRAARIVVDTSLHLGEMGFEEAVSFMRDQAGLTEEVARQEVTRYCGWPTQAASYLTGALQVRDMRDRWLAEGRGSLKEFHDRLAGSGSLPLGLAERAVLGEPAPGSAGGR